MRAHITLFIRVLASMLVYLLFVSLLIPLSSSSLSSSSLSSSFLDARFNTLLTSSISKSFARPSVWQGRLRWLERQREVKPTLLKAMFESGPPHEVIRAIGQRRWSHGVALATQASRDPRPRIRHHAYFALSQLAEIEPEAWARPLLLTARQIRSIDRVAALRALGASVHPSALPIIARHLDLRLNLKEIEMMFTALWWWGERGHFAPLTVTRAQRILDPSFKGSTRLWGVRLAALYVRHERKSGSLSVVGRYLNEELTTLALKPLKRYEDIELAMLALSAARAPELSRQVMQWWGLGQKLRSFTAPNPDRDVFTRARLRLASAHLMRDEPLLKLAPVVLTRLTHLLAELAREVGDAYAIRERQRKVTLRDLEMGIEPTSPVNSERAPLIPNQSIRAHLLGIELAAHSRLARELLTLKRPGRELIRAARRGVQLTHKWSELAIDLERRASLSVDEPLPFLSALELARLRCHLSALVDLKRHRPRALQRCGAQLKSPTRDGMFHPLKPLIGDLTVRIAREAITHHKLRDLNQLRAELPRTYLMELLRGIKLTRRRRAQIATTLKELISEPVKPDARAYEELHPLLRWIGKRRVTELASVVCETLQNARSRGDLYTMRVAIDTLGALRSPQCPLDIKAHMTSPHNALRIAAHAALSVIEPEGIRSTRVEISPARGDFERNRATWAAQPSCERIRFRFTYGEVRTRIISTSFHGARALCGLSQKYARPLSERFNIDFAYDGVVSLRLPRSLSWRARSLDDPQSERTPLSESQLEEDRWWLTLVGGELDELEERLVFVRGPLGPPFDQHGVIAEVISGEETLDRLGVGDTLNSLTRLQ